MIINILEGYIARAILRATGLTLLALALMLVFFTFIDELDDVRQHHYHAIDAFKVALLSAPRHLYEVFPVAALIGGLLGLGGLSSRSELVAMRASGFTLWHLIYAVLKTGLLMVALMFLIGEWLAPSSTRYAQQLRLGKQQNQVTPVDQHGLWAKDGHQFVNIKRILANDRLQDITLYQLNNANELVAHSHAATATYQGEYWLLHNIQRSIIRPDNVTTESIRQARWDSMLNASLLNIVILKPDKLPVWDLYRYIRYMQANDQHAIDYRVAFWAKLATPVLALLMLLLAAPFALFKPRSGAGQRIFIGAMLGALFFLLMRAASYASVVYHLNPLLMLFTPTLICLILTLWLLNRVR